MSKNRYVFDSKLAGYINVFEAAGKYNNMTFSFTVPSDVLEQMEEDRTGLLEWIATKVENPKRLATNPPKWDEEGLVKISYGGDTGRPEPVFVDSDGAPLDRAVLKDIRKGTKVRLIVQQSPYGKPSMGTTLKVLGVQVIELVSGNGAVDSGDLSVEDVAAIFGSVEGFKADSPAVRKPAEAAPAESDSYDF